MKHVVKLVIIDNNNRHLILKRSNHPKYPNDPDLPGGTLEGDEEPLQALAREIREETGIVTNWQQATKLYEGTDYAASYTYHLYSITFKNRPEVVISWEHSSYEWIELEEFLEKAKNAKDSYMHMVYDVLK